MSMISRFGLSMEKVIRHGLMEVFMMVIGKKIKCKAKGK